MNPRRGPNGEPIRLPQMVERLAEFARLQALGQPLDRIAFDLGVTVRTLERYKAMLADGAPTELTDTEFEYWNRTRIERMRRQRRWTTRALRMARGRGATVLGPDGQPAQYSPRSGTDPLPWLAADGTRIGGYRCDVVWPEWLSP